MTRVTMASVVTAVLGLVACGGSGGRDVGPGGIDASIPRNDAYVAGCGATAPEDNAAACGDGCDNDGNRFADCEDFACCGLVSCPAGTACGDRGDAGPRTDAAVMACATMGPEDTAAACGDGCDNDDNGFFDCADFDCCSVVSCGSDTPCGRRGDAGPRPDAAVMACATMGPENSAMACGDGCDNDGNGFYDCGDFDCCGVVSCAPSTPCGRMDAGMRADAGPRCDAGAGAPAVEGARACSDGVDNDCDGFTDCRDFSCGRDAPADRTYCIENTASLCNDMMDNDADRFVDCDDRDCCGVRMMSSCPMGSYIGGGRC
jgi:hypothetical protein